MTLQGVTQCHKRPGTGTTLFKVKPEYSRKRIFFRLQCQMCAMSFKSLDSCKRPPTHVLELFSSSNLRFNRVRLSPLANRTGCAAIFIVMGTGQRGWVAKTLVSINDSCRIISSGALLQEEADGFERQDLKVVHAVVRGGTRRRLYRDFTTLCFEK